MIGPGVAFDELSESHLRDLLASGERERRRLEFKRELPAGGSEAKREFLADVSSFANAGGGDLVFGVRDEDGVAVEITPRDGDADSTMLRLENLLRDGLSPRIPGLRIRPIDVAGGWVLVLRIPASWAGPHAVTSQNAGAFRFYAHTSAGKYPLDIREIRSAFLEADGTARHAREWQTSRLARILSGETSLRLPEAPTVVVHLVPLSPQPSVEPAAVEGTGILQPFGLETTDLRWNIDGVISQAQREDGLGLGYTQLFRDGHLEAVNAATIDWSREKSGAVVGAGIERLIIEGVANPLRALQIAGAQTPFAVLVAVPHARGIEITPHRGIPRRVPITIDRDTVLLPETLCDSFAWNRAANLRAAIDALWQASGWRASPNYTATGEWNPT